MNFLDIKEWLTQHSISNVCVDGELRFTHFNHETSILINRDRWHEGSLRCNNNQLSMFYDEYLGASIGNGHIVVGTNLEGGINVSHGFRIGDLEHMKQRALNWEMPLSDTEDVFMQVAGWMFIYGATGDATDTRLHEYDRDFKTSKYLSGVEVILGNWWQLVVEDPDAGRKEKAQKPNSV